MTGGNAPCAVAMGEDLEKADGVIDVKDGIDGQLEAEVSPHVPVGIGGAGSRRNDSELHHFLCSAEITEERISGVTVQRRQDEFCGYLESKWARSCLLERWKRREASSDMTLRSPEIKS